MVSTLNKLLLISSTFDCFLKKDKILMPAGAGPRNENITVTNDGATILKSMHVDNPAAKILIGFFPKIFFFFLKI